MAYAKSEETQRRLIRSTAKLLRTRGYAATGVSAIVKESGVPKGSLYHHFPGGKEELAAASVRRSGDAIVRRLEALADDSVDPVEAVVRFCDYYVEELQNSGYQRGCPLATVSLEAAPDVDVMHEACGGSFDAIVALLAGRLQREGVAPEAARRAADFTVASIEGALLVAKARRSTRGLEEMGEHLRAHLRALMEESER